MKRTEIITGVIALLALTLSLFMVPSSGVLTVISLSLLSMIYMYLSFGLLNGIRLRYISKKTGYNGISTLRIIGSVLTGFALSATVLGILFKFQYWPNADFLLRVGVIGLAVVLFVGVIKYSKSKSDFYTRIFKRIAIIGGLGLILLLIPNDTFLELIYRNHPDYIEAYKNVQADPDNKELQNKLDEELKKMYGVD